MKNKILLLICFHFIVLIFNAQTPNFQWAKKVGGTYSEEGKSLAVDASGNVYVTGTFTGTIDFDPGSGVFNLTCPSNTAGGDMYILKLDGSGNFVWVKHITDNFNNGVRANSIAIDPLGNVYTTGYAGSSHVDFDPNSAVFTFSTSTNGYGSAFVLKLDGSGNFVWAKDLGRGTSNAPEGIAIVTDALGNVYTTGLFSGGTADFDPSPNTVYTFTNTNTQNSITYDVFISKLDATGNFVWAKQITGTSVKKVTSIKVDGANDLYLTGYFSQIADFDPSTTSTYTLGTVSGSIYDSYILKLNSLGNFVWAKQLKGASGSFNQGNSLDVDASGNVVTTGYFVGNVDFDPSTTSFNISSPTTTAGISYITKLDPAGNFLWAKSLGANSTLYSASLKLDMSNNIYATGYFSGTADFDLGASTFNMTSFGGEDVFILKIDGSSNFLWSKQLGGATNDRCNSIAIDALNSIYTTGFFSGNADFDPSGSVYNLAATNLNDVFIEKLNQCTPPNSPVNTTLNQNICSNTSVVLSATSTGTINWYNSPTASITIATGNTYTTPILNTGVYTYYAEALSCAPSATRTAITITVTLCTSLDFYSNDQANNFNIYPNPTNNQLNLDIDNPKNDLIAYSVKDVLGQVLYSNSTQLKKVELNVSELPVGIYFITLQCGNNKNSLKFIKQ